MSSASSGLCSRRAPDADSLVEEQLAGVECAARELVLEEEARVGQTLADAEQRLVQLAAVDREQVLPVAHAVALAGRAACTASRAELSSAPAPVPVPMPDRVCK